MEVKTLNCQLPSKLQKGNVKNESLSRRVGMNPLQGIYRIRWKLLNAAKRPGEPFDVGCMFEFFHQPIRFVWRRGPGDGPMVREQSRVRGVEERHEGLSHVFCRGCSVWNERNVAKRE